MQYIVKEVSHDVLCVQVYRVIDDNGRIVATFYDKEKATKYSELLTNESKKES